MLKFIVYPKCRPGIRLEFQTTNLTKLTKQLQNSRLKKKRLSGFVFRGTGYSDGTCEATTCAGNSNMFCGSAGTTPYGVAMYEIFSAKTWRNGLGKYNKILTFNPSP